MDWQPTEWLQEKAKDGAHCPTCTQWAQLYWRSINSGQAVSAVRLYRWHKLLPNEFAHLPTVLGRRSAEEAKLRWWGLIEEENAVRPDGGRAGYWRLTAKGEAWAHGELRVEHYAVVFNNHLIRLTNRSKSGKAMQPVNVREALGKKFDYDALMRGEG